jgi:multidrug resistance efflux pump
MTTDDRIARLEAQIERLEAQQEHLRKQLTQAQLDQWYARIEDLEVQMHLGAMETTDRVSSLVQQLRARWAEAKAQVDGAASAASEVVDGARGGIERAIQELREALLDTTKRIKR